MFEAIAFILLALVGIKWATGTIVAHKHNEFKWYYLGHTFRTDLLKLLVFCGLTTILPYDWLIIGLGLVLAVDQLAGTVKNAAHYDERIAVRAPRELREPSRLRLGNPRNTQ